MNHETSPRAYSIDSFISAVLLFLSTGCISLGSVSVSVNNFVSSGVCTGFVLGVAAFSVGFVGEG